MCCVDRVIKKLYARQEVSSSNSARYKKILSVTNLLPGLKSELSVPVAATRWLLQPKLKSIHRNEKVKIMAHTNHVAHKIKNL
jgi:hypothetical protein